jgi:hypothetical protein
MAQSPKHPASEHHHQAAAHHHAAAQPITTISASMTTPRSMLPRLTNIASSLINIARLPTVILINDDGPRGLWGRLTG